MSKKIAFIGAGSFGFTYKLAADILMKKALFDCVCLLRNASIRLMR